MPDGNHLRINQPGYLRYRAMLNRCHLPTDHKYATYGARGIRVCEQWRNSFEQFIADMGEPPEGMTLDRIDTDGDYTPENCRWATHKEQMANKRNNVRHSYEGRNLMLCEWAEVVGMNLHTLTSRVYNYGWPIEKALTTPVRGKK